MHRSLRLGLPALVLAALASCTPGEGPAAPDPRPAVPAGGPQASALGAEARALWVSRFEYDSPAKIATIMQKAADANFNVVFFQVRGSGDAYYRSALEPCSVGLCGRLGGTPTWDPLAVAVREAHARGLQLHAWLNALTGWGSGSSTTCSLLRESDPGNPRHVLLAHPEWKVVNSAGTAQPCPNSEEYVYLSPGNAGVRTQLARVSADIARRYAVDGIHLDRIRYPGTGWSYDAASRASFGKSPASYPAEWNDFRRSLVNRTVRETYDSVRAVRASVVLSAAVWQIYQDRWGWNSSQGYSQYFQDPLAWARNGYLDVAAPMTYYAVTPTPCAFTDWACLLDDHVQRLEESGGRQVYIGIGAGKGPAEVEKQVKLGRQRGVAGFSVYSYGSAESTGLWAVLRAGVFQNKAAVPEMPWK
ncbi:MAG TPA: family 10 glycosylhydrolase [Longimicrobiaceae bacterium]|jgi:uncharacterized lipoprotein YddW (UPF0748 family)